MQNSMQGSGTGGGDLCRNLDASLANQEFWVKTPIIHFHLDDPKPQCKKITI